jgi:hypothetical protein
LGAAPTTVFSQQQTTHQQQGLPSYSKLKAQWDALTPAVKMQRTGTTTLAAAERRFSLLPPEDQQRVIRGKKTIDTWTTNAD